MKIVVLDGYTLNPGDLSWDALRTLGPCEIHDRTLPQETIARAAGAEIVLTNKTLLGCQEIDKLPQLRYVGVLATGYNVVDLGATEARGIVVTNVPTYGTQSVAQMVFAHLLNLVQHVGEHAMGVHRGKWTRSEDFCYWKFPLVELEGLTMGLVGLGRIGREVAKLARAFGMEVLAFDPQAAETPDGVQRVELDALLARSDVVSLHCPLTEETRGLINAERLARMKSTAMLINTSRGPLVDESALAKALNAGRLAGAGLDVLSAEPPVASNPLLIARNCYITPHIAWATRAARARLLKTAVENVQAFLAGRPQNVVH
ncbi:MAG TPA: glycerate dehydrogenase [Phycisphaerales bacterium]|nr:glycerate dehydrogenase [Phycisphaerales bacterium]